MWRMRFDPETASCIAHPDGTRVVSGWADTTILVDARTWSRKRERRALIRAEYSSCNVEGVRPVFRAQVLALASTLNSSSAQRASGEMWSVGVNFCTRASPGFGNGGWLTI